MAARPAGVAAATLRAPPLLLLLLLLLLLAQARLAAAAAAGSASGEAGSEGTHGESWVGKARGGAVPLCTRRR